MSWTSTPLGLEVGIGDVGLRELAIAISSIGEYELDSEIVGYRREEWKLLLLALRRPLRTAINAVLLALLWRALS